MIALNFIYKSRKYFALVRSTWISNSKHYFISIMNAPLQRLLQDNNVLIEDKNELKPLRSSSHREIRHLLNCIIDEMKLEQEVNH